MKALTYETIQQRIYEKYNGEYTLLTNNSVKILSRTNIQIKHNCGNILNTSFQAFVNDSKGRCFNCYPMNNIGRRASISIIEVIQRLNLKYTLIGDYISTKVKILVRCNSCQKSFCALPKDLFRKKTGCPICANSIRGKYALKENYLENLLNNSLYGDSYEYEWQEEYRGGNKIPHSIKHLTCGNIYKVRPNDFQQGNRCSECNSIVPNESKDHKLIQTILEEFSIPFSKEFTDTRCKFKNALRFDFAIPLKDKILLIEYDGSQHFKENKLFKNNLNLVQKRDNIKNEFAKKYSSEYALERISYMDNTIDEMEKIFLKYDFITLFNITNF